MAGNRGDSWSISPAGILSNSRDPGLSGAGGRSSGATMGSVWTLRTIANDLTGFQTTTCGNIPHP